MATLLFLFFPGGSYATEKIGIVYRGDIELHHNLTDSLFNSLKENNNSSISLWPLLPELKEETGHIFRNEQFTQLIAIGDLSLTFCLEYKPNTSGTFILVSNNTLALQAESVHWQGALIWAPIEAQLAKTREILPQSRTLGIIVSPSSLIDEKLLNDTAKKFGYKLNFLRVKNRKQILPTLSKIFQQNDAILMLPDPGMLNNVVLTEMLHLQRRYRTPLIALSERFVHFGAFMSIDYSLDEMVEKITVGIKKSSVSEKQIQMHRCCLVIHINPRTATLLRIKVPSNTESKIELTPQNEGGRT